MLYQNGIHHGVSEARRLELEEVREQVIPWEGAALFAHTSIVECTG